MFAVIVGCSTVGYYLTRTLSAGGHEVVVVEQSAARCQLLDEEFGSVSLLGDGTDPATLARAGTTRADLVVALTGSDATNLVICQLSKRRFQAARTMALVKDPKNQGLFNEMGVDAVVNSIQLLLASIEEGLPERRLTHLLNLRGTTMELVKITIPEDAGVIDRRLGDIELPPNTFVTLVIKKGNAELPDSHTELKAEDELVLVTATGDEPTVYEILTGV